MNCRPNWKRIITEAVVVAGFLATCVVAIRVAQAIYLASLA